MSIPLAAALTIVTSVYRVAISSRNLAQEAPLIAVKGSTRATTPLGADFPLRQISKRGRQPGMAVIGGAVVGDARER